MRHENNCGRWPQHDEPADRRIRSGVRAAGQPVDEHRNAAANGKGNGTTATRRYEATIAGCRNGQVTGNRDGATTGSPDGKATDTGSGAITGSPFRRLKNGRDSGFTGCRNETATATGCGATTGSPDGKATDTGNGATTGSCGWFSLLGIDRTPRSRYRSYIARLERVLRLRSEGDDYLRGELDRARRRIGHLTDYVRGLEQTNELLNGEVIRLRSSLFRHRGPDGRFVRTKPLPAEDVQRRAAGEDLPIDPTAGLGGWDDHPERDRWLGRASGTIHPQEAG